MAEDTLITALEEDARAQAARLLEEAREASDAVLREARSAVERERDRRARQGEIDLLGQRAALLNSARTRASGAMLSVRHDLIEKAMAEAIKRFSSMPKEEYRFLLNRLFSELKDEWEKKRPFEVPEILLKPSDVGLLETSYTLRGDEEVALGVVFASSDGTVRFENTIPARLEKGMSLMLPAINEMLFDGVFP